MGAWSIPDWQAYPRGFKDGREDRPILAHLCSPAARSEYERGHADGREYAKANPPKQRKRKEPTMTTILKHKFPPGPSFTVDVTRRIMEHARLRDSGHCMIAMAVRDVMPHMTSIAADVQTIRMTDREKGYRYSYLTPRIAQKAIVDWDQGEMPEPFSFRLAGAHVTRMTHRFASQTPRQMSDGQREALEKAVRVRRGDKAAVVLDHEGNGTQPRRVGGTLPPQSNFARRREFGLKAFRI